MTKVSREMIAAAHDVTMQHKIMLGHELLTEIYQAMNAKREFVGLTEEQINEFFEGMEPNNGFWLSFARAIEAKLRERNA